MAANSDAGSRTGAANTRSAEQTRRQRAEDADTVSIITSIGQGGAAREGLDRATQALTGSCEQYYSLAENGQTFQTWLERGFDPNVWEPLKEASRRAYHAKMNQLKANAIVAGRGLREGAARAAEAPGELSDEMDDDEPGAAGVPDEWFRPEVLHSFQAVAASELPSLRKRYELLVACVSDTNPSKKAILDHIADHRHEWTARQRLDYFIAQMKAATPSNVLRAAAWQNVHREGMAEPPHAYATRYKTLIAEVTKPMEDINMKFRDALILPWAKEKKLAAKMESFKSETLALAIDDMESCVDGLAEVAAKYEKVHLYEVAKELEAAGYWKPPAGGRRQASAARDDGQGAGDPSGGLLSIKTRADNAEHAKAMGLPTKTFPNGTYHACALCYSLTGKHVWHGLRNCPQRKRLKLDDEEEAEASKKKEDKGAAHVAEAGGSDSGRTHKKELLCWNCGRPGHPWFKCEEELKPHLKKKKAEMGRGGQTSYANDEMVALKEQIVLLRESLQLMAPRGGQANIAMANPQVQWFAPPPPPPYDRNKGEPEGGFNLHSTRSPSFASDSEGEDGTGLLSAAPPLPGQPVARPWGLPAMAGEARRSERLAAQRHVQDRQLVPVQVVPQSARRQLQMRDPGQDAARMQRNRLPTGMVNPRQVNQPEQLPGLLQPREVARDVEALRLRHEQLISLLRNVLAHIRIQHVEAELLMDTSPESATAWQRARTMALQGHATDGRDPRATAWQVALKRAAQLWAAQANLQWADYCQLDIRRLFREAVRAQYGDGAAQEVSAVRMPEVPAITASHGTAGVSPVEPARKTAEAAVSASPPQAELLKAWQGQMAQRGVRSVTLLDPSVARITVGGVPALNTLADTGSNRPMLHRRLLKQLTGVEVDPRGLAINNISGQSSWMSRTKDELTIAVGVGTDQVVDYTQRWLIMEGENLPDVLLDTQTMAMLGGMTLHMAEWEVTYSTEPWDAEAPRRVIPLRPMDTAHSSMADALARLYASVTPSEGVSSSAAARPEEVTQDDLEEDVELPLSWVTVGPEEEAVSNPGVPCVFMTCGSDAPNSHAAVGGGRVSHSQRYGCGGGGSIPSCCTS